MICRTQPITQLVNHSGICLDNVETQAFDVTQMQSTLTVHEECMEIISDDESSLPVKPCKAFPPVCKPAQPSAPVQGPPLQGQETAVTQACLPQSMPEEPEVQPKQACKARAVHAPSAEHEVPTVPKQLRQASMAVEISKVQAPSPEQVPAVPQQLRQASEAIGKDTAQSSKEAIPKPAHPCTDIPTPQQKPCHQLPHEVDEKEPPVAEEPSSSSGISLAKVRDRVAELVEVELQEAAAKRSTSELEHAKLRKYLCEASGWSHGFCTHARTHQ